MPRNSRDNSLKRIEYVRQIIKPYSLKDKYRFLNSDKQSFHIKTNLKKIWKIERSFNELAEPYKTIFKKTFFETNTLYWWDSFYSKTTFYRLRNKAIKAFIIAYEDSK